MLGDMADLAALFPGKQFISTVLEALETKTAMSGDLARRYLMRALMAGLIIGLMYVAYFSVLAAFSSADGDVGALVDIGRIVGSLVFGWALVFIYYSKSELLTSNMMIITIGAYYKQTTWLKSLRILGLCYLGNLLGGLLIAVLLRFSTLADGEVGTQMEHAVEHKISYLGEGVAGWGDLFVRAILCNFMINLAMLLVYNGLIKDDLTKSLVMIVSVFIFAFLGFEHSVANTVLFSIIGLQGGLEILPVLGNLAIALLGNFVGGGLLIGLYYAYVNDQRRYDPETGRRLPGRRRG